MSLYLWIKALHVFAVIAWMVGLLYLPRLFVYHAAEGLDEPTARTFRIMEQRLQSCIMNPAMLTVWAAGIGMLVLDPGLISQAWLQAKLVLVVAMTGMHLVYARWRRQIAAGTHIRSQRFYRIANEVPSVLLIGIVILVIVKPF